MRKVNLVGMDGVYLNEIERWLIAKYKKNVGEFDVLGSFWYFKESLKNRSKGYLPEECDING